MSLKQKAKEALEQTDGEEFDFHGDIASINAIREGESHVVIGHFVVARPHRRNGHGSDIFEALLEVLHDRGITSATVRIQALEDGDVDDPVMDFLRRYGFRHNQAFDDPKWGRCVEAYGHFRINPKN